MPKRKYLMLADGNSPHTYKWAKELDEFFDLYIVSLNGVSNELLLLLGENNIFNYKHITKRSGGNYDVLKYLGRLACLIKKLQPDIINGHYITSYGTLAIIASLMARFRGKVVLSAWGSDILVAPYKNKLYYHLTKYVLRNAWLITSDSKYMTDKIKQICKSVDVMTFPMGIEKITEVDERQKDDELFFSNRSLEKCYNIDKVIKIFYHLCFENNNRKLIVASDGAEKDDLMKMVYSLNLQNNVEFVGYLDSKKQADYYKSSRWYFSVPESDSTSVSLLEAMSYGCIPIVSDIPSNREWVIDGDNGIVVGNEENVNLALNMKKAFECNMEIIKKRGIWGNNIAGYIEKILNK